MNIYDFTKVLEDDRERLQTRIKAFENLHGQGKIDFNEFVRAIALLESSIVTIDVNLASFGLAAAAQEAMKKGILSLPN